MALLNPLLAYLLAKRLSSPAGGLVAAALVTLLGYGAMSTSALNIDAPRTDVLPIGVADATGGHKEQQFSACLTFRCASRDFHTDQRDGGRQHAPRPTRCASARLGGARGALALPGLVIRVPALVGVGVLRHREVYLVDRLPTGPQVPILIATALFLVLAAGAYASGMVARFLADERRRRWIGWLCGTRLDRRAFWLAARHGSPPLGKLSFEALRVYLGDLLAQHLRRAHAANGRRLRDMEGGAGRTQHGGCSRSHCFFRHPSACW